MYGIFAIPKSLFLCAFLPVLLSIYAAAQKPSDFIKDPVNNYGQLENGATLLSSFKINNPTGKNLYVLTAKGSRFITVEYSRRAIAPGSSDSIVLRYEPKGNGGFKEEVEVVLSALDKPITLQISGNIKNYNQDFLTQCIRFGSSTGSAGIFRFLHKGTVLDSVTGKPIQGASVQLIDIGGLRGDERTNRQGSYTKEVVPGLFEFIVQAPGYIGKYYEQYVNPQRPDAVFKLVPFKPQEAVAQQLPPADEPEEIIINQPENTGNKPITTPEQPAQPVARPGELSYADYKPNNVVFLIDVSASMRDSLKLPLLQKAVVNLLSSLRPIDRLAIVTYADGVNIVMPSTPVTDKSHIADIINSLRAGGMTEGGKGMKKAYRVAESNLIPGGNNQIILATDGAFSSLGEEEGELNKLIDNGVKQGIGLSILGFGNKKYALQTMEKFAKAGHGSYLLIKEKTDADHVLVEEIKSRSRK